MSTSPPTPKSPSNSQQTNHETQPLPQAPTIASVQSSASKVEAEASRLRSQLVSVSEALSARTCRSARLAASHAAQTDHLAKEAHAAFDTLRATTEMFVRDADALTQHFHALDSLAKHTAEVKAELSRLELQTARITAANRASSSPRT